MKIIIFAGGTGKRFWPASRKNTPKQFLSVIDNKPLIRLTYDNLRLGFEAADIFISTGIKYQNEVFSIIPELPKENFIFEPEMRDTGPAIAYAINYVHNLSPNEVISTLWSDQIVKNPSLFITALKEGEQLVIKQNKSVVIGVPARFPTPHRGYIKFGRKLKNLDNTEKITLCEFERFVEKPSLEVAKEYLASGNYAWNPSYLLSTYDLFMDKYQKFGKEIYNLFAEFGNDIDTINSKYPLLPKVAVDYIFSENLNSEDALVINVDIGWSDVGEWISLKEALEKEPMDNIYKGKVVDLGSKDCLIYNTDSKSLVTTINLKDLIIVNTPDVVAIFPKEENARLKELITLLEEKGYQEFL